MHLTAAYGGPEQCCMNVWVNPTPDPKAQPPAVSNTAQQHTMGLLANSRQHTPPDTWLEHQYMYSKGVLVTDSAASCPPIRPNAAYQCKCVCRRIQWQLEVPAPVVVVGGVAGAADQAVRAQQQHKEHIQGPAATAAAANMLEAAASHTHHPCQATW